MTPAPAVPSLVLASASSRRRALLDSCRIPYRVEVSDVSEEVDAATASLGPDHVVAALAARKAETVRARMRERGAAAVEEAATWILGADTMVEVDGTVLGKPADAAEAARMLRMLSGRTHRVHTGIALIPGLRAPPDVEAVCTQVCFRPLGDEEVAWYVDSGEWEGAAGAYRIQERAALLVEWINGSYSCVVGLPLEAFYGMLVRHHADVRGI